MCFSYMPLLVPNVDQVRLRPRLAGIFGLSFVAGISSVWGRFSLFLSLLSEENGRKPRQTFSLLISQDFFTPGRFQQSRYVWQICWKVQKHSSGNRERVQKSMSHRDHLTFLQRDSVYLPVTLRPPI